jgi:chromosome segregation ATPase
MSLTDVPDQPGRAETTSIGPEVQESLVRALPDVLSLLADTREQLVMARSQLKVMSTELEAAHELEGRLRTMVAALQDESLRHQLREAHIQLEEANAHISSLERQMALAGEKIHDFAQAAHLTSLRAEAAEAQVREIHASRSWRVGSLWRRVGSFVTNIGRVPPK